eukprot:m51a1_g12031 hypothetical protein (81) ;mRNA; f:998-1240
MVDLAQGGVLFADRAYDLDPQRCSEGHTIASELLDVSTMPSEVLMGYQEDMRSRLLAYNDGLESCFFESIKFDNLNEAEF